LEVIYKVLIFAKKIIMAVLTFTAREFRSQQARALDLADRGERILIRRRSKQTYALVPVEDDDLTISPELQAKIDKARAEIKAGKCITVHGRDELNAYLESL
jgi:antitoxin (DNA-binding transcriptional repressor) of toxin-antitoxin stability system